MAFNFLGSFKKRDLEDFETFTQAELDKIIPLVNHIVFERYRLRKTLDQLLESAKNLGIDPIIWNKKFKRDNEFNLFDRTAGLYVQRLKEPFYPNIKFRDNIEHKIFKLVDRLEQLEERIARLKFTNNEFRGDFEALNAMFTDKNPSLTIEG